MLVGRRVYVFQGIDKWKGTRVRENHALPDSLLCLVMHTICLNQFAKEWIDFNTFSSTVNNDGGKVVAIHFTKWQFTLLNGKNI